MAEIDDNSIDAIITDLPYGVLNRNNPASKWDIKLPLDQLWHHYLRVKKPHTPIILFGQGMFTAEVMMSCPKLWRYNLIWMKDRVTGHLNARRMPMRKHEDIIVFYEKLPVYNPQMEPYSPDRRNHSRKTDVLNTNRCYGEMKIVPVRIADDKYPTSIISCPREFRKGEFYHPTQKPVALLEYLIRTYSNEGDIILDNCIGTGTTALAAIRTNRQFVGFEIDKSFFDIANDRIQKEYQILEFNKPAI